ncbi:PBECR2 nuclease fold domain-containing protein [Serratia liquefaciens]|uniref:PBECR2 nuclease fold domain-containing protein n=1 Tax=Serratia liquefaciens TaxID=614 RepID=UPI00301DD787
MPGTLPNMVIFPSPYKAIKDKSGVARAIQGLTTFRELDLPDLRVLESEFRLEPTPEIEAGDCVEAAVALLELHMGFIEPDMPSIPKETIIGTLSILRDKLEHIVEKRLDARERYVLLALDTLENPYEVWEILYDDGQIRFLFIGAYRQKQQMLVVVAPWEGKVLWNFMHTDAKSLNKHRQGVLLYKRH